MRCEQALCEIEPTPFVNEIDPLSDLRLAIGANPRARTVLANLRELGAELRGKEVRKGHDVLIEAFNRAFTPDDDVELFMSCENVFLKPHEHQEWVDFYVNTELGSKVMFIKRQETQEEVYNTMTEMDCGVFPARAEGWNLELLEMMSCGKSVITTNCTGHTEFCNENNSMLIDVSDMELAYDGKFFNGQGDWYCLNDEQIDQLADYMKKVHKLKQDNKLDQNKEGIQTAEDFTWTKSAEKIVKILEKI